MPHNRVLTCLASVATIAIAASLIALGAPAASAASSAASRTINVEGIITGFTPKAINVSAKEEVSICLTSPDTDHDLTIPTADNFQVVAPLGPAVCKDLTAPADAGVYKFICSIPGHESAGMVGTLVVAAAGATAPTSAEPAEAPTSAVKAPLPQTSGGLTVSPLMMGGALLVTAMISALIGWRVARRD